MLKSVKKLCHIFDQPDHVPHVTGLGPHGHPAASVLKRVAQVPLLLLLATSPSPHPFSTATISWAGLQGVSSCPLSRAGLAKRREGTCVRARISSKTATALEGSGWGSGHLLASNKRVSNRETRKIIFARVGGYLSLFFNLTSLNFKLPITTSYIAYPFLLDIQVS